MLIFKKFYIYKLSLYAIIRLSSLFIYVKFSYTHIFIQKKNLSKPLLKLKSRMMMMRMKRNFAHTYVIAVDNVQFCTRTLVRNSMNKQIIRNFSMNSFTFIIIIVLSCVRGFESNSDIKYTCLTLHNQHRTN